MRAAYSVSLGINITFLCGDLLMWWAMNNPNWGILAALNAYNAIVSGIGVYRGK